MKIILMLILIFAVNSIAFSKSCVEEAKIVAPVISDAARKIYETKLGEAMFNFVGAPTEADSIIWLGRRKAYLGDYVGAIGQYSLGIDIHPAEARLYRHRGHRYISIRCFDDAVKDFEAAAKLVKGKPDEIEPDGLPNAKNIPTSTLQSNIFYHLGLAYYVKGDFKNALKAYKEAAKVSNNPDMLVATKHWEYMTLRRLGKLKEAEKAIAGIKDDLEIIENDDYYKLIKLYQGKLKAEDLEKAVGSDPNNLGSASLGYGLGNWFLYNGDQPKAEKIFRLITSGNQWASFGFIAAEAELK